LDLKKGKVLVIFTGGTFAMSAKEGRYLPFYSGEDIIKLIPELNEIAEITPLTLWNIDSSNFQPRHWQILAQNIYKHYANYDGFVIVHGTDTMVYTASALSFMLQGLGKPLLLTGSQIPVHEKIASDGRLNLINAVRFALMDIGEVCIFFGTKLLRGTRTRKISGFHLEAFTTFNEPPLGEVGIKLKLYPWHKCRTNDKLKLKDNLGERVALIKVFPGMDPCIISKLIELKVQGIVIEAFGAGNIPTEENSLIPPLKEAVSMGIPCVVCTQCEMGAVEFIYESGWKLKEVGVILAGDMTPECSYVKLLWLLGQTKRMEVISKLMVKNLVNELNSV